MAKIGMFMRVGKQEGVIPLPPVFLSSFSVNSYDRKFMSFKFGNDVFITFEMPRVAYTMIHILENHISLQFPPSVVRGPCLIQYSLMKINFRKPSHKSS